MFYNVLICVIRAICERKNPEDLVSERFFLKQLVMNLLQPDTKLLAPILPYDRMSYFIQRSFHNPMIFLLRMFAASEDTYASEQLLNARLNS